MTGQITSNVSRLHIVNQITQQIMTELEGEALVNNAARHIYEAFDFLGVSIFLLSDGALEFGAAAGFSPEVVQSINEAQQEAELGLPAIVAHHGKKIVVNDVTADARCRMFSDALPVRAELCLPLSHLDQMLGVLDVYSAAAFSEADVETLELLAGNIGVALRNANRFQTVRQELLDLKGTEKALRESEERFRQVVASISAHIYVTEVTENGRLINHYISPNVELLTGFPHEKFISDWSFWPSSVIYPDDRPLASAQLERLRQGQSSTTEYRLVRVDNQIIWVRDSGRVEMRGSSRMIYGVVSDITDRKKAEQSLVEERALLAKRVAERTSELSAANAKLARVARLKDEFLANMSHELRTPLNAILGMAEVLQSGVYGELNADQRNAARHIGESGNHLLALITDILDLSKIEAEKLDLDVGPVFIDFVCEASLRMMAQSARKKNIKLSSQFDDRVKSVQADQRRLKQILVNLLSNAVKFTPAGGQVGLYVQGDQEQDLVRFIVWDTGIGISKSDLEDLFRPFVQVDNTLSRENQGSGLGLSLVARLTALHGGEVSVESEIGKGSRFTVSLPWRESQQVTSPVKEAHTVLPGENRDYFFNRLNQISPLILLAEDNEANVITLTEFLQTLEYRVIVARNGHEAVQRTLEERPDLILMDIQMPGIDGLEAMRRIRAHTDFADLPIVALTALAMPGDRDRCIEAGADDYLSKPVSLKRLIDVIGFYLQARDGSGADEEETGG